VGHASANHLQAFGNFDTLHKHVYTDNHIEQTKKYEVEV